MLVLQHIYQRDVLQSLHTQQINELTNFAWTVQLRNYYNKGGDYTVSILNLNRKYGFEYLGLKDRICVTPTTEKCFRSLFHSLDTAQIGCIQGQVDSGKTQILA
jgi:dynein heavy chain